jgi:hypothetical protein
MGSSPVYFSVGGELTYRLKFYVYFRFQVGVSPYQPEQSRMLSSFVLRDHVGLNPTFRDCLSVPSSRVKMSSWTAWPLKMGPIGSRETSALNQITPRNNQKTEEFSSTAAEAYGLALNKLLWRPKSENQTPITVTYPPMMQPAKTQNPAIALPK